MACNQVFQRSGKPHAVRIRHPREAIPGDRVEGLGEVEFEDDGTTLLAMATLHELRGVMKFSEMERLWMKPI